MLLRVIVVTFLLGIAAFIQVKSSQALQAKIFAPIYSIIIATYILSLLYILFLKAIFFKHAVLNHIKQNHKKMTDGAC